MRTHHQLSHSCQGVPEVRIMQRHSVLVSFLSQKTCRSERDDITKHASVRSPQIPKTKLDSWSQTAIITVRFVSRPSRLPPHPVTQDLGSRPRPSSSTSVRSGRRADAGVTGYCTKVLQSSLTKEGSRAQHRCRSDRKRLAASSCPSPSGEFVVLAGSALRVNLSINFQRDNPSHHTSSLNLGSSTR